jgi:hypothetical protein
LPLYNEELDAIDEVNIPASVARLRQQLRAADAVLIATPNTIMPRQAYSKTPSIGRYDHS